MPNRIVREGWLTSRRIDSLDDASEKFFLRLILKADDFGRYSADPVELKNTLYPLKENVRVTDSSRWLAACEKAGLVRCYETPKGRCLVIPDFRQRCRAEASKFPDPPDDGRMTDKGPSSARLGEGEGADEGEGGGASPAPDHSGAVELPTEAEAITQATIAGILPEFAAYVFRDWSSRGRKDGAGVLVAWLPYVTRRWAREQVEWRAGTHRGAKNGKPSFTRPSHAPSQQQVIDYARQKWGEEKDCDNWAVSFHRYWSDPKRNWTRARRPIDWQTELTAQVARWRQPG